MNHLTQSNVIIGSKLALAMSMVAGSPVHRPAGSLAPKKPVDHTKMSRRCEALKSKSRRLVEAMEDEDARIAFDAATMRSTVDRKAAKRIGKVMSKLVEQQISLHSQIEKLLSALLQEIRSENHSNV
jgi:hypothetical protein